MDRPTALSHLQALLDDDTTREAFRALDLWAAVTAVVPAQAAVAYIDPGAVIDSNSPYGTGDIPMRVKESARDAEKARIVDAYTRRAASFGRNMHLAVEVIVGNPYGRHDVALDVSYDVDDHAPDAEAGEVMDLTVYQPLPESLEPDPGVIVRGEEEGA